MQLRGFLQDYFGPVNAMLLLRLPIGLAAPAVVRRLPACGLLLAAFLSPAATPERGFVSKAPASKSEHALVSGNGIHGAMVFGVPHDETVIINHGRLYMPLHKPLPPPETATILPEIRRHMADGDYQKAADLVVELANRNGYKGKHWTDPFIPACDLQIRMDHRGAMRNYERSVDFATGVASVAWDDDRGRFSRRLFVSRADDVIVMSIRGPGKGLVDCERTLGTRPDGHREKGGGRRVGLPHGIHQGV
jgi:hypothetical protein